MFLDDKLYQIGSCQGKDPEDRNRVLSQMISACADYLDENVKEGRNNETLQRMFTHWENAANKLNKEGYYFVKASGLRNLLESDEEIKLIIEKL